MTFVLSLHRGAIIDLEEALVYYETEASFDVAASFLIAVDEATDSILANPISFPIDSNGARRKQLRKFPYTVYFYVRGEEVRVVAVAHHRRSPNYWIDHQ